MRIWSIWRDDLEEFKEFKEFKEERAGMAFGIALASFCLSIRDYGLGIADQQARNIIEQRLQGSAIPIAKVLTQNEIISGFLQRPLGSIKEPVLIQQTSLSESFRNIRGYRNRGSPDLRDQTKLFMPWKTLG
jgi:hypothetical protein